MAHHCAQVLTRPPFLKELRGKAAQRKGSRVGSPTFHANMQAHASLTIPQYCFCSWAQKERACKVASHNVHDKDGITGHQGRVAIGFQHCKRHWASAISGYKPYVVILHRMPAHDPHSGL
jgi:hypothetical protein